MFDRNIDWLTVEVRDISVPDINTGKLYLSQIGRKSRELFDLMRNASSDDEFKRIAQERSKLKPVTDQVNQLMQRLT